MPRSKSRASAAKGGARTPSSARSRRRAGRTADFLTAAPDEALSAAVKVDSDTGEIIIPKKVSAAERLHGSVKSGVADMKSAFSRSVVFLRDELLRDPEEFFIKVFHSIGYGLTRFFKWFASFSRYLLLPLTIIIVIGVMTLLSAYTLGLKVTLNGEVLGYVTDAAAFETARTAVEEKYTARIGEPFKMEQTPSYTLSLISHADIASEEQLESSISTVCEDAVGKTYGLFVDGTLIGTYSKENAVYELLEAIKKPYSSGISGETAVFMNDVQVIQDMYADQFEMTIPALRAKLLCGSTAAEYAIKAGDTVESICAEYGITETVLNLLNPNVNINGAAPGTIITVGRDEAVVSVQVSRTITYEEKIPFDTVTSISNDLWAGTKQVVSAGTEGITKYTAQVVVVDGTEISRNIVNEEVLQEPVTQYELEGTKPISASGSFIWPVAGHGIITSYFGADRGSHYHMGLDIAANSGTDIMASDAGVVTWAGWRDGGFGYYVQIDHGNGIVTGYAHCVDVYVTVGQTVPQGYAIAGVGTTGNSTGNHLHFTVLINGMNVDPLSYIF